MIISDPIWGTFNIQDKVLIDLIKTKPVQRLKRINQAGASIFILSWKTVTRYDHSLGVMLLLRRFNASLEEQIAGLLHDVSHTVFSHVADFVFPNEDHEFHEKYFQKIILASKIPQILRQHDFSLQKIFDIDRFTLLENKIPDICADRIDYFFRDEHSQLGLNSMIRNSIKHFIIHQGEFIFNDPKAALDFAKAYIKRDESSWSDPREIALYKVLALAIKQGLEDKILTENDLFTSDEEVIDKLKRSKNLSIKKNLGFLNPIFSVKVVDKNKADFFIKNKLRFTDPKVLLKEGKVARVSKIYPQFFCQLEEHKRKMTNGFHVKINT